MVWGGLVLGYALTPDVPLGPFEGTRVTVFAAGGKQSKLHAVRSCGYLRTREVGVLQVALDAAVVGRLCAHCAGDGPWVRRETGLGIFLDALGGLGLLYQLGSYTGEGDDEQWSQEEVEAAAALLRGAPRDPGSDEDDAADDVGEAREEAERLREGILEEWRGAATSLHQAEQTLLAFPWLEQWARPRLLVKERYLAALRGQAALFVDPAGLLTAAAVALMEAPQLPGEDEAFTVLGTTADITRRLRSLWGRWQREAAAGWDHPSEHSWIVHHLVDGISSRRKGRDQALAAARALLATWADRAQQTASTGAAAEVLVTVTLPQAAGEEPYERGRKWLKGLGAWGLGVLVTSLVDADWGRGTVTVRVPELIAGRLIEERSPLASTPHQAVTGATAAVDGERSAAAEDEPMGPGIFDDTPIADRRPVTAGHLQALRAASGNADQLYLVFSAEQGAQVLPLSALEERCRQGWQGIIIAGASDLPGHLVQPEKNPTAPEADDAPGQEHPSAARDHDRRDQSFGEHLGVAAGPRVMERRTYSDRDREHHPRCLAMARGVKDLRTLDGGYDQNGHRSAALPYAVWHGLLAMSTIDLRPFRAPSEDRWDSASGIPLALLADVQIYTTNADPLVEGKGHSPDCRHAGDRGVSCRDDLLTLEQLLHKEDADWCGKCGGYAVRRLTPAQMAYYRAAHRLHNIAAKLRAERPPTHYTLDTGALVSELDELAAKRLEDLEDSALARVADTWRWKRIVDDLSVKARGWNRHQTPR